MVNLLHRMITDDALTVLKSTHYYTTHSNSVVYQYGGFTKLRNLDHAMKTLLLVPIINTNIPYNLNILYSFLGE